MKALYKIILFFAFFQLVVIMINFLGVFPYTFYSDADFQGIIERGNDPLAIMGYLFVPSDVLFDEFLTFSFAMLLGAFTIGGLLFAWATHSWTPVVVTLMVVTFIPMITKSTAFLNKIFISWDVSSLTYLAITLFLGVFLIAVFTILETPTHGRSG